MGLIFFFLVCKVLTWLKNNSTCKQQPAAVFRVLFYKAKQLERRNMAPLESVGLHIHILIYLSESQKGSDYKKKNPDITLYFESSAAGQYLTGGI